MNDMTFTPIGIVHSPFRRPADSPIQPSRSAGARGTVEIESEFAAGLRDLDGFSHVILLYGFHLSTEFELEVVPFLDTERRGVFATRSPKRPNPIGLSIVKLDKIEGCTLHVSHIDVVDGTPLLDIKPYVPDFDQQTDVRIGWLDKAIRKDERDR